jgi:hypothetical protein
MMGEEQIVRDLAVTVRSSLQLSRAQLWTIPTGGTEYELSLDYDTLGTIIMGLETYSNDYLGSMGSTDYADKVVAAAVLSYLEATETDINWNKFGAVCAILQQLIRLLPKPDDSQS